MGECISVFLSNNRNDVNYVTNVTGFVDNSLEMIVKYYVVGMADSS